MSEISSSSTTKNIVWKIRNINKSSFASNVKSRDLFSKHFTVINDEHYTEWKFKFQPINGDFEFFLHLVDSSTLNFKVDFNVRLVSSKNEGALNRSLQRSGKEFPPTKRYGWGTFVYDDQLMQRVDNFVVNESLIFFGTLTVHLLSISESKTLEPSNQDFFTTYKIFFQNETLSDFKIESKDGKIFNCHKLALALKSEVFEKMLTSNMRETQAGICKIEDFDSKIVEAMLKHIYFQEISNLEEIATKLIFAAEKYELKELKKVLIDNIVQNLKQENVIGVLKICDDISETDLLFKKCVAVVFNNWLNITESEDCKSLSKEILLKLYKSHVHALSTVMELTNEVEAED